MSFLPLNLVANTSSSCASVKLVKEGEKKKRDELKHLFILFDLKNAKL
jgi:hypothetical protein